MLYDNMFTPTHEISPLTLAVVAKKDETGNVQTVVLEDEIEYKVEHSPSKFIDYACKFFGASLKGRQEGTKNICGITHKAPISIDPSSGMYFFPTTSPTSSKCSWIAHSHIDHVLRIDSKTSEIVFKNGKKVVINASYGSVMNQIHRTAQYRYLLDQRIKQLQQRDPDPGKEL
ncbi:competence protein ComK [Ornithinibacillus halotolerans]|uniref:Competence protein n=1 Tax=Ornithinibacillus halotolerans TaxID=1274357 RepID=A0A916W6Z5_9BACI|nr:competence protein ComK [Ornithinibacillus halotolerans]GGA73708.1 competence protein [Ornithinibacillus halotolerans]